MMNEAAQRLSRDGLSAIFGSRDAWLARFIDRGLPSENTFLEHTGSEIKESSRVRTSPPLRL